MFGWQELVARIGAVYQTLAPDDQQHCVIYVRNYGEAAALDFFGKRYGLPRAVCPHNSYWYWGAGVDSMRVAIIFGGQRTLEANLADLLGPGRFESADLATTTQCEHCMPFENHRLIFLCRGPRFTFREIWPGEKLFI
jgi:hypothetical protein